MVLDDAIFDGILPAGVHGVLRQAQPPGPDWSVAYPGEAAAVAGATAVRVAEYATGRACARAALEAAGSAAVALPPDGDGLPEWPAGYAGSVAHCRGWCAAVAARASACPGLGLDLELFGRISERAARRVVHPDEAGFAGDDRDRATILFSLKEAFYKAAYPLTRRPANFNDVALQVDPLARTATVSRLGGDGFAPFSDRIGGMRLRYVTTPDHVVAFAWRGAGIRATRPASPVA